MAKYAIQNSKQVALLAAAIVFTVLPTIAIVCRILARRVANRALDLVDYLMSVSLCVLSNMFTNGSFVGIFEFGAGIHTSEIRAMYGEHPNLTGIQVLIPIEGLWALSLSTCKLSVLLLYRRLFPVPYMTHAVNITIGLIVVFLLTAVIGSMVVCQPIAYNWDKTIAGGHCGDLIAIIKATGSLNLVTDVLALTIALPQLYMLQLPLYKRAVLLCVFGIGMITCVISILRIISLATVDFDDLPYTCVEALIYSAVEPSLAVVLACVPLLRPLLNRGRYSETGTRVDASSRSLGPTGGYFKALGDDSSHYRLRPLGPRHNAQVSASRDRDFENDDEDGSERGIFAADRMHNSIRVKQEWKVSQEVKDDSKLSAESPSMA
ncbi:uncharacterized protein BCR38DRAFT_343316 [Pseudomassariella vexata]|uniref:Rhodopsin domain-containing protein n=1 Tax=Pseudomassariella vexata TaxID=1141098 RepID=A0A1Y2DX92_9PEZI|nr:uncharacterized protein BCR38DRAFT_343316 [Pseudomassariella vexata]ORY63883.1 hypothetical protein BCR38DRAFT_343316 [Pseudomassariella vexata]